MVEPLDRAIHSGRFADDVVDPRQLKGQGDLIRALVDLAKDRVLAPPDRLRQLGYRAATRIGKRIEERLRAEWKKEKLAEIAWPLFTKLASQLSERIGFGPLDLWTEESSALVHVCAWDSPFPEILGGAEPTCLAVEGFAAGLLVAVSGSRLSSAEIVCRTSGAAACELAVGPEAALKRFLSARKGLI